MRYRILILVVMSVAVRVGGVALAQESPAGGSLLAGCVDTFDPDVDYFPDKVTVDAAENFSVEYFNNYKLVSMLPWTGADVHLQYLLVQCGTPIPDGYGAATVIEVPVQRFVAMSTSILPHLTEQALLDRLVGVDTSLYTSNPVVLERVGDGTLVEVGGGGTGGEINLEVLLALEPDLVMAQEFFAGGATLTQLAEAGMTAVLNADYADATPLGQAEWGKYVSLFFNTEAAATAIYDNVAAQYNSLSHLAASVTSRPTVIAASPFGGVWYMPAGDSAVARLLADAGADFVFSDERGTSVPLDFEVVLERGGDAEYWVNVNQFWATQVEMLADDGRFSAFRALQDGNLWNNNARMNENGGSDYFETGVAHPEVILADLISIFHPDLLPEHELVYYQWLSAD